MNISTSAAGSVRVEIQSADGTPLPGFALGECEVTFGDAVDRTVAWKSGKDVSALAGKAARLRFALQDADQFSYRFE